LKMIYRGKKTSSSREGRSGRGGGEVLVIGGTGSLGKRMTMGTLARAAVSKSARNITTKVEFINTRSDWIDGCRGVCQRLLEILAHGPKEKGRSGNHTPNGGAEGGAGTRVGAVAQAWGSEKRGGWIGKDSEKRVD